MDAESTIAVLKMQMERAAETGASTLVEEWKPDREPTRGHTDASVQRAVARATRRWVSQDALLRMTKLLHEMAKLERWTVERLRDRLIQEFDDMAPDDPPRKDLEPS